MDNADNNNPRQLGLYNTTVRSTQRFTTLQWENIMSPTLLSSSSISFNRTRLNPNIKLNINYPESLFIPWHSIPPQFSYGSDVATFGVGDRPTHRTQNKWEMSQSFSYARGAHAYKFGASWAKIGFNTNGPAAGAFGSFNYESAEDFLTDSIVDTFQVEVEGADTARTVRQNVFGFYFQDDWQVRPNFTLNLGMRFDSSRGDYSHRWPQFLPDGRHFLYLVRNEQRENSGIYVGSLDSNETKRLLNTGFRAAYSPLGYLLLMREETMMAQPFDAERLELTGEPFRVADGVEISSADGSALFSVSATNVLAYVNAGGRDTQLVSFDREGQPLGPIGPPGPYPRGLELSPDGKRIAVRNSDHQRRPAPGGDGHHRPHQRQRGDRARHHEGP